MSVTALVGAQYGSEGKGVVAKHIANHYGVHVRTGGPNAGHSFVHKGKLWKMQAVPCGWVNPEATIVIGANAVVNPDLVKHELTEIAKVDPDIMARVMIDFRAGVLDQHHHDEEGGVHGDLHDRIGSTGEGVGTSRRDRLMRDPTKSRRMEALSSDPFFKKLITDSVQFLNAVAAHTAVDVLLEGTQGFGLSLIHGPWPKTTSADTTAAQLLADAGIAPKHLKKVIMVARTMPIRVAGNSGPLQGETSWEELSKRLGRPVEERTTVTRKVRRIGEWDDELVHAAAKVNGADEIALTFLDYINPKDHGVQKFESLSEEAQSFVERVSTLCSAPVSLMGTGFSESEGWSCIDHRLGV